MIEIGMQGIVKNYGFTNVLSGASFEVQTGERAAIVGRNGTGKTTLLKLITGEELPKEGQVTIRRGATVGYLEQIPELSTEDTLTRHVLLKSFGELSDLESQMRNLEAAMNAPTDDAELQRLLKRYAWLQSEFTARDGYAMEESLDRVVSGFSLETLLDRPFNVLSGGQKTIVKLAATILGQPDILLLDEPTNHLDMKTLEWFEGFLAKYRGTVIIVSHDRYFLDKVATKTIILEHGECLSFQGNYSFSLKERERQLLIEFEQYKTQQKKIAAMEAAIRRYRQWFNESDNEKFIRKAKELEKRLEKMDMLDRPQLEKKAIPLALSGERTGKEVLIVKDLSLAMGEARLLDGASVTVYQKEKVAFIGDNGTGKTSLVRAVLGDVSHYTGEIRLNPSVAIGYVPQEIRFADDQDSVLAAFRREYPCPEGEARNILAKFFFYGEHVFKRVSALSGGEKVLLKLAVLVQRRVNFLILDEPTNHIDIETRELLEETLMDFTGTLLFISHDRYLINKVAGRIVEIRGRKLHSFYGDYDGYRRYLSQ